jgi:isochorismate synthase EntC
MPWTEDFQLWSALPLLKLQEGQHLWHEICLHTHQDLNTVGFLLPVAAIMGAKRPSEQA